MATHFRILAENSMDRRAWHATINGLSKESDTTEQISLTHSLIFSSKILGQKLSHSISGRILFISFLAFLLLLSYFMCQRTLGQEVVTTWSKIRNKTAGDFRYSFDRRLTAQEGRKSGVVLLTVKQKDDHTLPKDHEKKGGFPGDYPINHSWAGTDRLQSLQNSALCSLLISVV